MMNSHRIIIVSVLLVSLALTAFWYFYDPYKPLHKIPTPATFPDDLDRASLIEVLKSQKNYLEGQAEDNTVAIGPDHVSVSQLHRSVAELLDFLSKDPSKEQLDTFLQTNYLCFQAGGRKSTWGREMLVTGYYEPLFEGSLLRQAPYLTPLYKRPSSLIQQSDTEGKKRVGRYDRQQEFIPFWSRREIETGHHLAGDELVYLKDPFDAYLLHVQGSGKIVLPDGSVRAIGFAGSNGLGYKSIGKYLVDQKIMELEDVNIPAIRQYLEEHPEELLPLLHHNPRFIFFHWRENNGKGPRGSSGEALTAGRSIAIDQQALPTGTIAYLKSQKPVLDAAHNIIAWEPMERFVFPQDSGAAIQGTGRVDLFWGSGIYAETAANHMKHPGELYFLIPKSYIRKLRK